MFGCAAREITKNKSSLPALQELPSPHDFTKNQTKPRRRPMPWSKIGKFKIGTGETTRGSCVVGTTKKRQGYTTESRKSTPYEIRNLELKSEEILRNKRKFDNWKRRQELKLKNDTEVLDGSKLPRKKTTKEHKKKTKTVNIQRKTRHRSNMEPIRKMDIPVVVDCWIFCLEKRQPTSTVVMFTRLKSNRRYKPGD